MSEAQLGKRLTPEHRQRISSSNQGRIFSAETRALLSRIAIEREYGKHFRGGVTGEVYASFLYPLGYIQEYRLFWGGKGEFFPLDFGHPEIKVDIELDGPYHRTYSTVEYDQFRDKYLKSLGWKIIRICHA